MKLTTPFTILNRKFNEMDKVRDAINKRKIATVRLHKDYRKMYKTHQFAYWSLMEFFKGLWLNQPNTVIGVGIATLIFMGIYIKLLNIYQ